jgi:hypothetical protein
MTAGVIGTRIVTRNRARTSNGARRTDQVLTPGPFTSRYAYTESIWA